jgi:hypothetical protein
MFPLFSPPPPHLDFLGPDATRPVTLKLEDRGKIVGLCTEYT